MPHSVTYILLCCFIWHCQFPGCYKAGLHAFVYRNSHWPFFLLENCLSFWGGIWRKILPKLPSRWSILYRRQKILNCGFLFHELGSFRRSNRQPSSAQCRNFNTLIQLVMFIVLWSSVLRNNNDFRHWIQNG